MNDQILFFYIIILVINLIILFKINYFSKKINLFDYPKSERKIHLSPTPLLGGVIIFINIFLFLVYFFFLDKEFLVRSFYFTEYKPFVYFLLVITCIFVIGIYDDKYDIAPTKRIILISTFIILFLNIDNTSVINFINLPFTQIKIEFNLGAKLFTYLCLIILIISCNMFDGINFQSFLFYSINFIFLFILQQNYFILLIIFSLIFFGILNFNGKIFLGDSGVYLLSSILGIYYIKYFNANILNSNSDLVVAMLFFPILDATKCISIRLINGKNPFMGDNSHFHHKMMKKFSKNNYLIILFIINIIPSIIFLLELNMIYSIILVCIIYIYLLNFRNRKII